MPQKNVPVATVIGGSGFLGRYIVQRLAKQGWRVKVAVRRPDKATFVRMYGGVGQVEPVQVNIRYPESLHSALAKSNAVINCVGLLAASGKQTFDAVQVDGARAAAQIARGVGAHTFVQVSAIGADANSEAAYARTKAEGEQAVLQEFPDATIIRPSIIFGAEDEFFNRFAQMAKFSPVIPVIGADTRFQPVYVDDVAHAVEKITCDGHRGEKLPYSIYETGGADIYTFREMMQIMLRTIYRKRAIVDIPMPIARIQAQALQHLPGAPLTPDQVIMLAKDNIVSDGYGTLTDLDIVPRFLESVLPEYLVRYRPHGQFEEKLKRRNSVS